MPQWVMGPDGAPVYVDETGNPTAETPELDYAADLLPDGGAPVALGGAEGSGEGQPVVDPLLQPVQPTQPSPSPQPTSPNMVPSGEGVTVGQGGFQGPGVYNSVVGTQGKLNKENSRVAQATQSAQDSELQATQVANQRQRESITNEAGTGVADVTSEMEAARSEGFRQEAKLHSMFAAAESTAADLAATRTSEYRARYEAMAQQVAAMNVQPGLNLTKGEGVGLGMALFAQGFLGAQGVPVADVRGMVSNMVDRNVDLQLEKIRRGEKLTEQQRMLWDMARSDAEDEATARQRLRGLMLASAASSLEGEMAKYGSKLATAKGIAASADLWSEFAKNMGDITQKHFKNGMDMMGMNLDKWKAEVAASQGWANVGINKRQIALEEEKFAAGKGPQPIPESDILVDTSSSGDGAPLARFRGGLSDKTKEEVGKRASGTSAFVRRLREYKELAADAGAIYGGDWGKAMANKAFAQRVISFRNGLGEDMITATTGAAAPEAQMQRILSRVPIHHLTRREGGEMLRQTLNDLQAQVIDKVASEVQQFTIPLSEQEKATLPKGTPRDMWAPGETAEAEALRKRDVTPVEDRYTNAVKTVSHPEADITHAFSAGDKANASPAWTDFVKATERLGVPEKAIGEKDQFYVDSAKKYQPKFAQRVEFLVKDANSTDPENAKRAQKALTGILSDPGVGYRANWVQHLLEANPVKKVYIEDDPATPADESDLYRDPASTGIQFLP